MLKAGEKYLIDNGPYYEAKADKGKRRYSLLVWSFIRGITDVLEFGAKKYNQRTWMDVPEAPIRYYDALMRHLHDGISDTDDEESGLNSFFHAGCCLMFLYWLRKNKPESFEDLIKILKE